jgi:hypothetical protein
VPSYVFRFPATLVGKAVTIYTLTGGVRGAQAGSGSVAADGSVTATLAAGDYLATLKGGSTSEGGALRDAAPAVTTLSYSRSTAAETAAVAAIRTALANAGVVIDSTTA